MSSGFEDKKREIIKQHNEIVCLPSFEEFRELELLRQTGRYNMYTDDIMRAAYDMGLYACVTWLDRCKSCRILWQRVAALAEPDFVEEHGPRETWVTPEMKLAHKRIELENKKAKLRAELEDLEDEIKQNKASF